MRLTFLIAGVALAFSATGAAAQRAIDFAAAPAEGDALIAAVSDVENLGALEAVIGDEAGAALRRAVASQGFKASAGSSASYYTGAARFGEIHLIGVEAEGLAARDYEDFGGLAAKLAAKSKADRVAVLAPEGDARAGANVAFGAALGQYDFTKYKSNPSKNEGELLVITDEAAASRSIWDSERRHVADAVLWARDQQSEPANILYPEEFVARARAAFRGVAGVTITVLDENAMRRRNMGAILGVGQGSVRPPRMLIVEYSGGGDAAPMVFAGKGITFDTGGISIKSNSGMWRMKYDMTGAASVTAAVLGLAKSRAPVNVVAIAALAENMPSGSAQRPGDVVTTMSGKTIEIMSTDAEGRLVLADAVEYAQAEYAPSLLVDVATLTGSVGGALSDEYAGLFARSDEIAERMIAAGERSGEDLWRLPLHPNYDKQIASAVADVKNSDTGSPGAGTGAAFIGAFVKEETPWAHLDIAGVGWRTEALPTVPNGGAGFAVRLLDTLAREDAR